MWRKDKQILKEYIKKELKKQLFSLNDIIIRLYQFFSHCLIEAIFNIFSLKNSPSHFFCLFFAINLVKIHIVFRFICFLVRQRIYLS